jgi:dTDP-4-dehydrorhamnose reductase
VHAHASFPDAMIEPQHGVLDSLKITQTFGIKPRAWRTGLAELLDSYYRNV